MDHNRDDIRTQSDQKELSSNNYEVNVKSETIQHRHTPFLANENFLIGPPHLFFVFLFTILPLLLPCFGCKLEMMGKTQKQRRSLAWQRSI